jgi:hypothetical protein
MRDLLQDFQGFAARIEGSDWGLELMLRDGGVAMKARVLGILALVAGLLGLVMPARSAEPHWPEALVIGTASPGGT